MSILAKKQNTLKNAKNNLLKSKSILNMKMLAKRGPDFQLARGGGSSLDPMLPISYVTTFHVRCYS